MGCGAWIRNHLLLILYMIMFVTVLIMIAVIGVFCLYVLRWENLMKYHQNYYVEYSLVLGAFFCASNGILIYRVFDINIVVTVLHILLHLGVIICLALNIFVFPGNDPRDFAQIFKVSSLMVLTLYILQSIVGVVTVVIWRGQTPLDREKRSGMHAFTGLVTFTALLWNTFMHLSMMCGAKKHERRAGDRIFILDIIPEPMIMIALVFLYSIVMLFIVLTPYFEAETREELKKEEEAKPQQKTEGKPQQKAEAKPQPKAEV